MNVFLITRILQDAIEQRGGRVCFRELPPEQQFSAELLQAQAFFAELFQRRFARRLRDVGHRLTQVQTGCACIFFQLFQALAADPARGKVDDPPQADFVLRVVYQPQERNDILHLAPTVEALRPHQPVTDALAPEGFFQQARLGVGAVHHGKGTRV